MGEIRLELRDLLLVSVLIGMFFVPAVSTALAPSVGGNTSWLDTIDGWAGPRDMSMYNKPVVTKEPERPGPEDLARYPGMILLGENVTFPDAGYAVSPGLPSGPTAHVAVVDPAYFSPVPPTSRANLTVLPPLRRYDLVTADPEAFVAAAGSGGPVTLRLPGREFVLDLEPVPGPVAEGARAFVKNESGTFEVAPPRIWFFSGTIAGESGSFASFTVGGEVILGAIRSNATSLIIGQAGTVEVGGEQKVVHVVYDERDVAPACGLNRLSSQVKILIDAMGSGACRGADPFFDRTGKSDPGPGEIPLGQAVRIASDYVEEGDGSLNITQVAAR